MIASRPLPGYLAALVAAGAVTFLSSRAHAGSCTTDAECGKGLACQVVGSSGCAAMACPPGADCPPPPPCMPTEIKACVPGPCNVDSDCGDGMLCHEETSKNCATAPPSAACAPGQVCDPPPPDMGTTCTTTTEKLCVPRWALPCTAASDCGTGFNCVLDTSDCACAVGIGGTGTAGTPGTEPAPAPAPTPGGAGGASSSPPPNGTGGAMPVPDCPPCPPATTSHCEPQVVDCAATSDCPAGWLCTVVGGTSSGGACGAPILPDGGIGMTVCEPAPPPTEIKVCTPPYYGVFGHGSSNDSSSGGGPLVGLPGTGFETGAAGSGNTGKSAPPQSAPAPGEGAAASSDQGGCQIGHGSSSTAASLLALVGLVGLARRKRVTRREG